MSKFASMQQEKKPLPIPEAGSLGLLALGAEGYRAWRRKRAAAQEKNEDEA